MIANINFLIVHLSEDNIELYFDGNIQQVNSNVSQISFAWKIEITNISQQALVAGNSYVIAIKIKQDFSFPKTDKNEFS